MLNLTHDQVNQYAGTDIQDENVLDYISHMDFHNIPDYMIGALIRWIAFGISPGSFLTAVLQNDLTMAFAHADGHNSFAMQAYARFLHNEMPSLAWREKNMREWHENGGLVGLYKKSEEELTNGD